MGIGLDKTAIGFDKMAINLDKTAIGFDKIAIGLDKSAIGWLAWPGKFFIRGHMSLATRSPNQEMWPLGCHSAKTLDNIKAP